MPSIFDRIRNFVNPTDPKPKTHVVSSSNKDNPFAERDRSEKTLNEYRRIYEVGGLIGEAIRTYALTIFSNGWRVEGDKESLVAEVEDRLELLDLDQVGPQAVIDAMVFGDSFQEKAFGNGAYAERIVALLPRPAWTFEIVHDETGTITGYKQVIDNRLFAKKVIDLEPRRIFHFNLNVLGGNPYGISLIKSCYKDILRDITIAEGIANAIKRHGTPKYQVKVGAEDQDIDKEIIQSVATNFRDINARNEFVTPGYVEIVNLDQQGLTNTQSYADWITQRLCAVTGVPEEMLGLGRGSTEATANIRQRGFYDKVAQYQRRYAKMFSRQVIDDITQRPGAVKIVFNDPSPQDQMKTAEFVAKLMSVSMIEPDLIISPEEARALLGFEEVRETDDEPKKEEPEGEEE